MDKVGTKSRFRVAGYFLPMVLVLLAILLILMAGIYTLSQRARDSELLEESQLALLLGTQEIHANTLQALTTGKPSGVVNLREDFQYQLPKSELQLSTTWSPDGSLSNPVAPGWASYDFLFGDPTKPPQLAFGANTCKEASDTKVSVGHTLLHLKSSASNDGGGTLSSYSHLFPYGIYAPGGKVVARSVKGFANPPFDSGKEKSPPPKLISGRPVEVFAGADLTVSDSFRNGRALSVAGPIKIPVAGEGAGAIPISAYPHHTSRGQAIADRIKALGAQVAQQSLDKTEFLDDELFTIEHLRQLFKGNVGSLMSFFGVGQACKVPFFPIPGIQNDAPFLIVFYVMVPYPVDFSGVGPGSGEQSERLRDLAKEIKEKQEELDKLNDEIAKEQAEEKPDKKKIAELQEKAGDLKDEIASLTEQANEISEELKQDSEDIAKTISQAKIPQTASEDAEQPTKGWAYLYILGKLVDIVNDLLTGQDPFKDIFASTRVVHLGDSNPEWKWSDGKIDMKANLSVPQGRTLAIGKQQVVVRGDVLLMRGSVLKVDGNLTIARPDGWADFKGVPVSNSETLGYPMGRLLMEPGSSLIVSGDLKVQGGSYDLGSVVLVCPYGPNRGITQLIQAGRDIEFRHGMVAGVSFGDLIDDLAKDNQALAGFNDDFFRPFILDLAPQLAKFPYIGPWQWRKSYFAQYSTTFEFIPIAEVIGLGGPWPIPLPFDNCLNRIFKYVSIVYSTELNFFTGENLYTMSPFWIFGRGVSPVILKVRSALVADALGELKWGKITLEAFEKEGERFLKDVLPSFAVGVFKNLIVEVITSAVKAAVPFNPVSCGDGEKSTEAEEIKEKAEEFLKEVAGEFGSLVVKGFQRVLLRMKESIYEELDGDDESEKSPLRELPGAAVLAGGNLTVGNAGGARLALGLLIAEQDVTIHSSKTVGTVISLEGDVEVEDLYHYPYYDRVSLYNPFKFDGGLAGLTESLVDFETIKGTVAGQFNGVFPRRLAEGWR